MTTKTILQRMVICLICLGSFGVCYLVTYFITSGLFQNSKIKIYPIDWAADHKYWYFWILIIVFALINKPLLEAAVAVGNVIGLIAGKYLGDYFYYHTTIGLSEQMHTHYGYRIWYVTMLIFIAAGCLYYIIKNPANKSNSVNNP